MGTLGYANWRGLFVIGRLRTQDLFFRRSPNVLANSYFLYVSVAYSMVLKDKRNHSFLVCNLRPVFEKVKFDVRRSLEPFKDLDGHFDPSLAHSKC